MKKRVVNLCAVRLHSQAWLALLSAGGLLVGMALPAIAQPNLRDLQQGAQRDVPEATQPVAVDSATVDSSAVDSAVTDSVVTEPNRLVLSLQSRRVYLYQGEILLNSYPVAIGTAATPTPQGEFTVSKMVENPVWQSPWTGEVHAPGPNSALGLRWIEFASSDAGAFGFHGTPTVDSIGYAASNGCVRMYNEDVVALFAQVSVGTPVSILP